MADPIVISSLSKKRAEIDGAIRADEKQIAQLRADFNVINAAICIFDPFLANLDRSKQLTTVPKDFGKPQ